MVVECMVAQLLIVVSEVEQLVVVVSVELVVEKVEQMATTHSCSSQQEAVASRRWEHLDPCTAVLWDCSKIANLVLVLDPVEQRHLRLLAVEVDVEDVLQVHCQKLQEGL